MVLSSFEEFQPRDHSAAPRKPRPSRSIPSCAGHRARGHGTAVCAPHPSPRTTSAAPLTRSPHFQTKRHRRTGGEEPPATASDRDPSPGGSEWGDTEYRGAGASPAPSSTNALHCPSPRPPALPAAPSLREASPPGLHALEGAGIPASEPLGSRLSSGPSPFAYLCCGPSAAVPEVLAAPGAGFPGSPRAPAQLGAGAGWGRGQAPPSPRTGGRNSQSEAQATLWRHLREWL